MSEINKYWDAVQADVCAICIDRNREGECGLPGDLECGLKRHFPGVVNSILSVQSENFGAYVAALREKVCASCDYQSKEGECHVRASVDCGLDRYFPLIVDSIEKFRSERSGISTEYLGAQ